MKVLKRLFVLVAFIGLLFSGCSEKSSPVASSTDYAVNSTGGPLSLGKITMTTFTGSEVTVDFLDGKYVASGKRLVDKGVWFESIWSSSLPLLDGAVVDYTFNVSFNGSGEGPMQGKFTMTVGGGTLEGQVEGTMFAVSEDELQGIFKYVGHGKGGTIDGMKFSCTETYHESKSYAFWPYGDLAGYIK
jgi:hypothetical protein